MRATARMQGNGLTEPPRADLPQLADSARRNTAESDNSSDLGQATVTTTQARKVLGAWRSPENRDATRFDSNSSQR